MNAIPLTAGLIWSKGDGEGFDIALVSAKTCDAPVSLVEERIGDCDEVGIIGMASDAEEQPTRKGTGKVIVVTSRRRSAFAAVVPDSRKEELRQLQLHILGDSVIVEIFA